jgi:hypothetical protein
MAKLHIINNSDSLEFIGGEVKLCPKPFIIQRSLNGVTLFTTYNYVEKIEISFERYEEIRIDNLLYGTVESLYNKLKSIASNTTVTINFDTGEKNTPSIDIVTSSGTIENAYSVSIYPSIDFVGTILGSAVDVNLIYKDTAEVGKKLDTIAYTITAGSLTIFKTE